MKSRNTLMLLEITMMLLVFSIAAALCLKAFAVSEGISEKSLVRDEAVILAQNTAELLKYTRGDIDAVMQKITANDPGYELHITPIDAESSLLGLADVVVFYNGEEIFSLRASWQEVAG